jgi:hypothetical protein
MTEVNNLSTVAMHACIVLTNNAFLAYGHIKLISFTQFTQVASKKSSGSPSSSNADGRRTLLGKRTLPVTPQKPSTSSSSTASISLSQQSPGSPNLQSPSVRRSNRESPDTYSSNTPIHGMRLYHINFASKT